MITEKTSAERAAYLLAVNGGSSSIKFALFHSDAKLTQRLRGKIDRIGLPGTSLSFEDAVKSQQESCSIEISGFRSAADFLLDWLERQIGITSISAVGHRVVHGMRYTEPQRVTREMMEELRRISAIDPEHLPGEIELIDAFRRHHPELIQMACFDTAFHRTMPRAARLLPIPRRYDAMGIQRYGFHGLSYSYLMEELARIAGAKVANGKIILAHLGNGASLAAVRDGKSVDTSMGFTPAAGLPMGTRPGDLDPGVAWYLMQVNKLTPEQFNTLINHESGLLGVSETSSDMRDLLKRQASDIRCAEAVELFCYQTRKWIGAFATVLGGLETLAFTGGIGESAGEIRARICSGLAFLGVELDERKNTGNADVISAAASPVTVRVIKTDEELMIARAVFHVLQTEHRTNK